MCWGAHTPFPRTLKYEDDCCWCVVVVMTLTCNTRCFTIHSGRSNATRRVTGYQTHWLVKTRISSNHVSICRPCSGSRPITSVYQLYFGSKSRAPLWNPTLVRPNDSPEWKSPCYWIVLDPEKSHPRWLLNILILLMRNPYAVLVGCSVFLIIFPWYLNDIAWYFLIIFPWYSYDVPMICSWHPKVVSSLALRQSSAAPTALQNLQLAAGDNDGDARSRTQGTQKAQQLRMWKHCKLICIHVYIYMYMYMYMYMYIYIYIIYIYISYYIFIRVCLFAYSNRYGDWSKFFRWETTSRLAKLRQRHVYLAQESCWDSWPFFATCHVTFTNSGKKKQKASRGGWNMIWTVFAIISLCKDF